MSASAPARVPETPPTSRRSLTDHLPAIVLALLLIVAFWPIVLPMYGSWFDERAYMEHGILVIPAAAYMAWSKRSELARIPSRPSIWGVALLIWGAAQSSLGLAAQWVWVARTSLLISFIGLIAATYGFQMVRALAYPLGTLILMITPPTFVYERLTLDLQLLASRMGEASLEGLGYSVMREGNVLELVGVKLSVEEACSGIRSLLSILFMCALYNYFFVTGRLTRTVIMVLAVPIAILGNAGRIIATGVASQHNRALIEGIAHEAFGYISVLFAAIGCVVVHLVAIQIQKMRRSRHA